MTALASPNARGLVVEVSVDETGMVAAWIGLAGVVAGVRPISDAPCREARAERRTSPRIVRPGHCLSEDYRIGSRGAQAGGEPH
jgi:hypothetical protein